MKKGDLSHEESTLSLFLVLMLIVGTMSFAMAADGKTYSFEIVSKGFQSTYWQAVLKGCLSETQKLNDEAGYEMIKFNMVGPDSESDIAVQVNEFESALNAGPRRHRPGRAGRQRPQRQHRRRAGCRHPDHRV